MARLLCLGHAPLPWEESRMRCSGHLRTWQFVKPLLDAGHQVRLVAGRVPPRAEGTARIVETRRGSLHYFSVDLERFEDASYLQEHHDRFAPDAVVGINNHPASRAVRLETEAPVWCDLNGWAMAEAQAKALTHADDVYVSHFWNMERAILERADRVSTVSVAQKHAIVGELAALGRLGRSTLGYDFCHVVPNAALPELGEAEIETPSPEPDAEIWPGLPAGAFVLLWSGGYNTWADVKRLADVLERAMAAHDELFFLSTGGALPGHDTVTFERFRRSIRCRGLEARCHFTGWIESADVPRCYALADLGLNVDRRCYETIFGARNRINDMVGRGLPVLTTLGTEISRELAERALVLAAEPGDTDALLERIDWAIDHRRALRAMAGAARSYLTRRFSYAATTGALVEWARAPERAPDRGRPVALESHVDFFKQGGLEVPGTGLGLGLGLEAPGTNGNNGNGNGNGHGAAPTFSLDADGLWLDADEPPERRCVRLEKRLEHITGSKFFRLWTLWHELRRKASWAP